MPLRGLSDGANYVPDPRFRRSTGPMRCHPMRATVGAQDMSHNTGCSAFRVMSSVPYSLRALELAAVVMLRVR
ncbi:hypothetical protein N7519_001252 [Penicillium mononematosum]|uniref:uncharacterized protein n=1 Tax=Penicillium mononematosum TaxID=268346 RepID=UPI002548A373|nr:uncharacterized protein N7519_001252 [Penicillium mononematosum]KAJ6191231.1 hypothetical protein N7519_001252 [Penicillium mononematosum]